MCLLSVSLPPAHRGLCLCLPGESGLGKSTLINSLFLTDLYSPEYPGPSHRIKKTVQVIIFPCFFHLFYHVVLHITCVRMLRIARLSPDIISQLHQVELNDLVCELMCSDAFLPHCRHNICSFEKKKGSTGPSALHESLCQREKV